jgi:hypothetical protein
MLNGERSSAIFAFYVTRRNTSRRHHRFGLIAVAVAQPEGLSATVENTVRFHASDICGGKTVSGSVMEPSVEKW